MIDILKKIDYIIGKVLNAITVTLFLLLLVLLAVNVLNRIEGGIVGRLKDVPVIKYIPTISLHWFDEIKEILFAWLVFLGSALLWRNNEHFRIELIYEKMESSKAGHIILAILELLSLLFVYILAYEGLKLTIFARDWTPIFNFSRKYMYVCMPISGFLMVIYTIRNIIKEIKAYINFDKK